MRPDQAARDLILPLDWDAIDWDTIRRERRDRAALAMSKFGLDAVVAFEYANGRYLSDLRPLWAPNFLVRQAVVMTAQSEDVIVFVHQDDTPHRRATMDWIEPSFIREFPTAVVSQNASPSAMDGLREALHELGYRGGRIGVDIATPSVLANLATLLPGSEIVDLGPAMAWARMIKSTGEIAAMSLASAVVDVALGVAIESVQPGVRECEVLAEVMRVFYRHGAEVPQCNLIVCSGPATSPMQRFAGERRIEEGDLVFIDIGACFRGMFSEATRTVACGTPNPQQRSVYSTVMRIHDAVIESLQPGTTTAMIQGVVSAALDGSPYASNMQRMIIAHGIGVGYAEAPFIPPPGGPPLDFTVEAGMTLAVVPTILAPNIPGGGGVRLEDVIAVTDSGPRRLTVSGYAPDLLE